MTTRRGGAVEVRHRASGPGTDATGHVGAALVREVSDDADTDLDIGRIDAVERPVHRGAEVVELEVNASSGRELVDTRQLDAGALSERRVVARVTPSPVVGRARLVDLLTRVLTKRLEHRVARRVFGRLLGVDHGLADETCHRVQHVPLLDAFTRNDGRRRGVVEASREHTEPVEHQPFAWFEQ